MEVPPPPGRRARKRQQTRDTLIATAAALFDLHGYDAVTMEQIAAHADVAKRTLYNHFPTKDAVLADWLEAQLARDLADLQPRIAARRGFRARIDTLLDASAAWCERHPARLRAYLQHRMMNAGAAAGPGSGGPMDAWRLLIARGQDTGELDPALCVERLATAFHHLYFGAMLRWLDGPEPSLRDEFRAITDLFLDGARAPGEVRKPAH
ncbi:TetR/AcrR family transcriptional regulator [Stenotrophomonas mori]|uniref:TetR/AcrR family transcriptional regulator n=1 Tax=Stenotrophomonas mori TaxID=2871096 RepID=A0ABT0SDR0_9GAMM|nr:TetR/AcrR family transcriptional regulator [Stenotrophomonas mori]MCL7713407.1 TetR/AcrR family transcriptional regulator [Stenotrophomonas mori]